MTRRSTFYGCSGYPDCDFALSARPTGEKRKPQRFRFDKPNFYAELAQYERRLATRKTAAYDRNEYGKFLACPNFPKCKNIVNLEKPEDKDEKPLPPCRMLGLRAKARNPKYRVRF